MSVIETRSTLGDKFIKGMNAKVFEIQNQADQAYSLGINSALGVEENNYTRLFKKKMSDNARETSTGKTGIGYATLTEEGVDYKSDSRSSTYETQFNFVKYTNGITITEEDKADRIVDSKLDQLRDLMVGAKMTLDKQAFDIFNKAFTAQASLPEYLTYYGDAVPAASTLHPIKVAGSTQSNASATGILLTDTNLDTGRQALRRQVDDKNLPMNIGAGKVILLVPDSLESQAVRIAKSTKRSGTANNDLNIYDGIVTVISTKWINSQNGGSDTQWFLIDSMNSPFIFFERQGIKTNTYMTNSNKNLTVDFSMRHQIGNIDFRGFWASKGDSAAYAS